jgi:glycosyltransferase involved in cell wall biosynthesis
MERLLVHHARVGDRSRFRYSAAYVVDRPHSVVPELEAEGVSVHRLTGGGGPLGWATALRSLVRDEGVDVVHLHSPAMAAVARPVLRTMRPRPGIVTTEHNSWDCYSWPTRLANVATYPLDDRRLAVSEDAVASVPRLLRGETEVLVHGIDLEGLRRRRADRAEVRRELGVADDAVVALVVANHRAEKAWDVMLAAAADLIARHPEVVFLGAGHGQLEEQHRREAERLGLGPSFRVLGFRSDVERLLAAADVFTLSSRQEGLPVAVMEAMALGLPIVATRVGGLPLAVEDGTSGLLVPPEDPAALAAALEQVVGDPDLRARLGSGAAAASAAFDVRRAVSVIEERYDDVSRG